MNNNGMPIIHDIAKLLGCLRESSDNLWEANEFQESKDRILNAKQELIKSSEKTFSWDHRSSPQFEQPDSLFWDSETTSSLADEVVADLLEESMCQEGPSTTHQDSQQQSRILFPLGPRLDTGVSVFDHPSSQMGSLSNQFSEPNFGSFDTADEINVSPSGLAIEVLDQCVK
jgi:hypothetical protein